MAIEITMPRLSDTMENGTLIKWYVNEGEVIETDHVLADIETDKATMEMPSYDDGTVAAILVPEGSTVDVGQVLMVLAEDGESADEVAAKYLNGVDNNGGGTAAATESDTAAAAATTTAPSATKKGKSGRLLASPLARRMAEEMGIDLGRIDGTGPGGRIVKRDVLAVAGGDGGAAAVARTSAAPATPAPAQPTVASTPAPAPAVPPSDSLGKTVPLSNMRQTIARRLVESKTTIPHYQVTVNIHLDPLLDLRRMVNEQLAAEGVKLSVNDFLVRACAVAMHEHPMFNASWNGDSIQVHDRVNVGVAISLPEEQGGGLVVATLFDADRKGLRQISTETRALAEKARARGLTLDEMSNSTFTLSNLGMFGVDHFTAIINPPNSAILAVGAGLEKPIARDGEIFVGHEMSCTLSNDHRVIDGATAARFLQTLKSLLENPTALLNWT